MSLALNLSQMHCQDLEVLGTASSGAQEIPFQNLTIVNKVGQCLFNPMGSAIECIQQLAALIALREQEP